MVYPIHKHQFWATLLTLRAEMGLTIREYTKRDGRGRSRKIQVITGFDYPGIFDVPYDAASHRHFILRELRFHVGRPPAHLGRNKKKSERLGKYQRHVPSMWKAAILRDAPLLKGFFEEEPAWREKMLRWCNDALEALSEPKTKHRSK